MRLIRRLALAAVVLGTVAGCTPPAVTAGAQPAASVSVRGASPSGTGPVRAPASRVAWPAGFVLPNRTLTPGAVRSDPISMICPSVSPVLEALRPSAAVKAEVYAEYGIPHHVSGQFEIDHDVPVSLDGADTEANLWPEPNDKPSPATIRAEHLSPAYVINSKDILEDVLHRDVCAGTVPLATAQRAIVADWRVAYIKFVGKP